MNEFAKRRLAENADPNRVPYNIFGNNCASFVNDTLQEGGARLPWVTVNPTPQNMISELADEGYPTFRWRGK